MAARNLPRSSDTGFKQSKVSTLEEDGCSYVSSEVRRQYHSECLDSGVSMSMCESLNSVCNSLRANDFEVAARDSECGYVSLVDTLDSCESKLNKLSIGDQHALSAKNTGTLTTLEHPAHGRVAPGAPSLELYQELFNQDEDGDTKLHLAIIQPDVAAAMWMIAACAPCRPTPLNIQNDRFRQTPLHVAVIMNQPRIVRMLVVCGASVDLRDHNGNTALHLACGRGLLECIRALTLPVTEQELAQLAHYCQQVRLPNFMPPPFHAPDFSCLDYEGYSYLHLIHKNTETNHLEAINHLVSLGADVNIKDGKSGQSVLHVAVKQHDVDFIRYLLSHPSLQINLKNYSQHTAIDVASYLGYSDVEELLSRRGAIHSYEFLNGSDSSVDSSDDDCDETMDDYDDFQFDGKPLGVGTD